MSSGDHVHRSARLLWTGATLTAAAAIFFPRIQGIRDRDESWWTLLWFPVPQDREGLLGIAVAAILIGLVSVAIGASIWAFAEELGI